MKVVTNRRVFVSALKEAHSKYLWVAPIPIVLVVMGQNYGLLANAVTALGGYVVFFVLFFIASVGVAKMTWAPRRAEYEHLTDDEKGRVVGGALGPW